MRRWRSYLPFSAVFRWYGHPPNGRYLVARVTQLVGGHRWAVAVIRHGDYQQDPRPAARVTTAAERAPLYAAYRAARARAAKIGGVCDDDSIIQHAVQAYETTELARLRADLETARAIAKSNKKHVALNVAILDRIEALLRDTDGADIGDVNIPAGELRRALYEPVTPAAESAAAAPAQEG